MPRPRRCSTTTSASPRAALWCATNPRTPRWRRCSIGSGAAPDAEALAATPIVVRRAARSPVLLRPLPIGAVARGPFLGARVLLALTDLAPKPGPPTDLVARAFGLTRAEARLASLLATGIAPEAAAVELGISRETVRSRFKGGVRQDRNPPAERTGRDAGATRTAPRTQSVRESPSSPPIRPGDRMTAFRPIEWTKVASVQWPVLGILTSSDRRAGASTVGSARGPSFGCKGTGRMRR